MAWVASDTFDSYSNGSLSGANGGSGWSGAWSLFSSNWTVQGTTVYEGTKAIEQAGSTDSAARSLSSAITNNGVVYIALRKGTTNDGELSFNLRSSVPSSRAGIKFNSSGNCVSLDNGTTIISGYTANQWYVFRITFTISGSSGTYTVAYSTGVYGSSSTFSADTSSINFIGSGTNIARITINSDTSAGTDYADYISPTSPFVTTNIKTWDGVARANVKTLLGVASANIKTINGIA